MTSHPEKTFHCVLYFQPNLLDGEILCRFQLVLVIFLPAWPEEWILALRCLDRQCTRKSLILTCRVNVDQREKQTGDIQEVNCAAGQHGHPEVRNTMRFCARDISPPGVPAPSGICRQAERKTNIESASLRWDRIGRRKTCWFMKVVHWCHYFQVKREILHNKDRKQGQALAFLQIPLLQISCIQG